MGGLRIKTLSEILSGMVTWVSTNTKKITDFNVGSAVRTLLEAVALQMEEFYYKMYENIMWGIENSIYHAFGFELKEAKASTGYVTVFFNYPISESYTFKAGTKFATSGGTAKRLYFSVTKDKTVPAGAAEVMLHIQCDETGETGNVPINTIISIVSPMSIVKGVTNTSSLIGGSNDETKAERKQRFLRYIKTLARGTVDAIAYGCLEVEGVNGVWIEDTKAGLIYAYVHDINGELSGELRAVVEKNLDNYRSAGVEVQVLPVIKRATDLDLIFVIQDMYDTAMYKTVFYDAIAKYLNSFQVSQNLYLSELTQYTTNLYDDVIVSMHINRNEDIFCNQRELIRAGNIHVDVKYLKEWGA